MSFSLHSFQPLSALSWSEDGYAEFKMDTISNTKELQNQWWAQHKANSETKMQLLITLLVLYFETLLTPKISWMMVQDAHCEYWYWHVWLSLSSNDMTTLCRVMCLYLKCQALRIVCFSSGDESVWGRSVITIGSVSAIDDTVRVTSRSLLFWKWHLQIIRQREDHNMNSIHSWRKLTLNQGMKSRQREWNWITTDHRKKRTLLITDLWLCSQD